MSEATGGPGGRRPDPEKLLNQVAGEDPTRGKLTIFFGYAAGVGKTYAMLSDAHEKLNSGVDVVVGYVEPHTRPETMKLVEGLPSLPPKDVVYRDIVLHELDVDAALARRPQLILVDELAHTNAPGSRNKKRYQDVEELLRAGIDVSTTVNVQHLESLNNVVSTVTGAPVHETVPDYIFDRAEKVKIIDLEPEDLLHRFAEGKVYSSTQAGIATANFFTPENLKALREVAIREAANRISHEIQTEGSPAEKTAAPKLLVCVGPSPGSAKCVRWTARMAEAMFVPWVAVYVEDEDQDLLTEAAHQTKHQNIDLAQKLGAEVVTLSGVDVPAAVAEYVKLSGITSVVVGQGPRRRPLQPRFADRLVSLLPGVEFHLVPDDVGVKPPRRFFLRRESNFVFSWQDMIKTGLLLVASTMVSYLLMRLGVGDQNVIMMYILGVLVISRVTKGYLWGIVGSIFSVLLFNFFFVPPSWTFNSVDPGYPITFVIMLLIALVTSALTVRVKTQARLAVKREQRTEVLYEISRQLVGAEGNDNIVQLINEYVVKLFGRSVIFYTGFDADGGPLQVWDPTVGRGLSAADGPAIDGVQQTAGGGGFPASSDSVGAGSAGGLAEGVATGAPRGVTTGAVTGATAGGMDLAGGGPMAVAAPAGPGAVIQVPGEHAAFLRSPEERSVAHWVFTNQKPAGAGTDTLGGAGAIYLPVVSRGEALGVIGVSCERTQPSTNSRFFLQTIISQVAMALERQALSEDQRETMLTSQRERLRGNLLQALSYDLRNPLTGIAQASSLLLGDVEASSRGVDGTGGARPMEAGPGSDRSTESGPGCDRLTGGVRPADARPTSDGPTGGGQPGADGIGGPRSDSGEDGSGVGPTSGGRAGDDGIASGRTGSDARVPLPLDQAERRRLLMRIKGEATWLSRLLENLLSATRIADGTVEISKEPVAVDEVVGRAVDRLRQRYPRRTLNVMVEPGLPKVPMESLLIEQVLLNLVENAIRHTPAEAPVDLSVSEVGGQASFSVIDHGDGIPADELASIFAGSSRRRPAGSRGRGLGMSICKSIVDAHDGTISASNLSGGGAAFTFTLPEGDQ